MTKQDSMEEKTVPKRDTFIERVITVVDRLSGC